MANTKKKERLSVKDRHQSFKTRMESLTKSEQQEVLNYSQSVRRGIEAATCQEKHNNSARFIEEKEKYYYELMILFLGDILNQHPSQQSIKKRAKILASTRKKSWKEAHTRQEETVHVNAVPCDLVLGEDGCLMDVNVSSETDWQSFFLPPDPYRMNPEECLCQKQLQEMVTDIASNVRAQKRKRSQEWATILDIQLSGKDVLPEHKEQVGADSPKQLRELKSQAFNEAGRCIAEHIPDLEEKQALYKKQKGKKYHIQKSTFEQRKALYREPKTRDMEPRTIRVWKVLERKNESNGRPDSPDNVLIEIQREIKAA